ncbi:MAG: hypothetical protein HOM58_18490 [Rhodospirillaceae bacterium]|jgi:hypothetical protein|nr:hypothetical protein [Rhodospirillaceae bacterium]MBT5457210.1 hypothetical protein [Rhodospirillaceae bacterium]
MSPDGGSVEAAAIIDQPMESATEEFVDVVGFIDSIGGSRVAGWVWNRERPGQPLEVEIRLDNQPIATVTADRLREDLVRASVGDGRHGFEAQLPEQLAKEERQRVTAIVHLPGIGGEIRLKNQAAVSTDALALRPSDFSAMVQQIEQCVSDQRAGFRWIYHELHELDQFVRNQPQNAPAIEAAVVAPLEDDDIADAICAMETQITEMVQNQAVIQDTLEEISQLQKTLNQRLEQQDGFNARIESGIERLQDERDEEPDYGDEQRGLKRLILFLGCLTVASLATGIAALFF